MIKIAMIEVNNDINLIFIIYFCNFDRYNFDHLRIGYIHGFKKFNVCENCYKSLQIDINDIIILL